MRVSKDPLTQDTRVPHNNGDMDIIELRAKLSSRRGEWTRIAESAGVTRRTIYRIVNGKNMPNLQTVMDLQRVLTSKRNGSTTTETAKQTA